jgi:hypothetical protein
MKRALVIVAIVWWLLLALLLLTFIKDWLWTHPWWHAFLVAVPGILTAGIALLELRHSGEANDLRRQNNELRETLDSERNQHLQDIARHTKPQPTAAERMAAKLRGYIGQNVMVSEGKGVWASSIQIAEVSEDCIATLFSPASHSSTQAWAVNVHCNDLELVDMGGQVRLRVNKRYGDTMDLGKLMRWGDRDQPAAAPPPMPEKGHCAFYATYSKAGSTEKRELDIYAAKDGSNRFILEARPSGSVFTGDNVDISKRFMMLQVEIEADAFTHSQSANTGSQYRLYVKTH